MNSAREVSRRKVEVCRHGRVDWYPADEILVFGFVGVRGLQEVQRKVLPPLVFALPRGCIVTPSGLSFWGHIGQRWPVVLSLHTSQVEVLMQLMRDYIRLLVLAPGLIKKSASISAAQKGKT